MTDPTAELARLSAELDSAIAELNKYTGVLNAAPSEGPFEGRDSTGTVTVTLADSGRPEQVKIATSWTPSKGDPAAMIMEASAQALVRQLGLENEHDIMAPQPDPNRQVSADEVQARQSAHIDKLLQEPNLEERAFIVLDELGRTLDHAIPAGDDELAFEAAQGKASMVFSVSGPLTAVRFDERWLQGQSATGLMVVIGEILDQADQRLPSTSPVADLKVQLDDLLNTLGAS
ncbi:MAG: hypothetical protein GXX86_12935 [Propionibacterium sp.]|nr:hypothetical protein [Propionibacterium sp.]